MNRANITTLALCITLSGCMSQSASLESQRMQAFGPDIIEDNEIKSLPSREDNLKSLTEDILNIIAEDIIEAS